MSNDNLTRSELADIIHAEAVAWGRETDHVGVRICGLLSDIAARLSPAQPAPVPVPCMVVEYPRGLKFGIETTDRTRWWCCDHWQPYGKPDSLTRLAGTHPDRASAEAALPSAVAALRAAPCPPGGEPAPADGKPFDADKWADAVIRSVNVTVTVIGNRCSADIPAGAKAAVVGLVNSIYAAAHAAGDAAGYSRGKAEQGKPRRWPEGRLDAARVLRWHTEGFWYAYSACNMKPGDYWLPQPPSPEAAQGKPR